jgi:hypothetical protein
MATDRLRLAYLPADARTAEGQKFAAALDQLPELARTQFARKLGLHLFCIPGVVLLCWKAVAAGPQGAPLPETSGGKVRKLLYTLARIQLRPLL